MCGLALVAQQIGLDPQEIGLHGWEEDLLPSATLRQLCQGAIDLVLDDLRQLAAVEQAFGNSAIVIHGCAVAATDPEYLQVVLPAAPKARR